MKQTLKTRSPSLRVLVKRSGVCIKKHGKAPSRR
jgi:hypothetical protein